MSRILKMLRIYNWSDLHLDYNNCDDILKILSTINVDKSHTNCLIIPGDLASPFFNLNKFLDFVSNTFNNVFYVAGNHEYYSDYKTMNEVRDKIKDNIKKYNNITFLNNEVVKKYGYNFIGTTLWSKIPEQDKRFIKNNINDYNHIYIKMDDYLCNISVNDTNLYNKANIHFLNKNINDGKCIVITHHAPLFGSELTPTCNEKYYNSKNNSAFHNNLSELIKSPIELWIYGHTHHTSKFKFNNVLLWTNQYGYTFENNLFNVNDYVELEIIDSE